MHSRRFFLRQLKRLTMSIKYHSISIKLGARDPPGTAPPYVGELSDGNDPLTGDNSSTINNQDSVLPAPISSAAIKKSSTIKNEEDEDVPSNPLPINPFSNSSLMAPSPQQVQSNTNAIVPTLPPSFSNHWWSLLAGTKQEGVSHLASNVATKRKRPKIDNLKPMDE